MNTIKNNENSDY